jgi:hypothetical protein
MEYNGEELVLSAGVLIYARPESQELHNIWTFLPGLRWTQLMIIALLLKKKG